MEEDDGPPGVPEWVVTYGDMMSLLLTFFIMLVSLSEVVANEKYRAVLNALQQYVGYQHSAPAPPGEQFPLNSLLMQLDSLGSHAIKDAGRGGIKSESVAGKEVRIFRTREGKSVRVGEPIDFGPEETSLSEQSKLELEEIGRILAGKPNKIEIRAHASAGPLPPNSPFADKRVLTYERARSLYVFLIEFGVAPQRIRLTAAGDVEPATEIGRNRELIDDRAEVLLLDAFDEEYVGPRDRG